jgi:hypothetical protein
MVSQRPAATFEPAMERLFAVLLADDDAGQPKFSTDQILAYLPLLMSSAKVTLEPSDTTRALFERVAHLVGASAQDTDDVLGQKLADYYRAHPPSKELEQAFARFCQEEAGVAASDAFDFKAKTRSNSPHVPVSATGAVFDVREQSDDSSKEK